MPPMFAPSWLSRFVRPRPARRTPARRPRPLLELEHLEERELLAVCTWTGADVNGNLPPTTPPALPDNPRWSDSNNWAGGIIPKNGDDIIFPTGTPKTTPGNPPAGIFAFNSFDDI